MWVLSVNPVLMSLSFGLTSGWSSFYPSLTVVQHGIPCCEIHIGDICLPPGHPDAINFDDSGVFDTFKR